MTVSTHGQPGIHLKIAPARKLALHFFQAGKPPWLRAYLLFGQWEPEEPHTAPLEDEWLARLQQFQAGTGVYSATAPTEEVSEECGYPESSEESFYDALYHLRTGRPQPAPHAPATDDPLHRFTFAWLLTQTRRHLPFVSVLEGWLCTVEEDPETQAAAELEAASRGPPGPALDGTDVDWASVVGEEPSTSVGELEHLLHEELGLSASASQSKDESSDHQGNDSGNSNGAVLTANGQEDALPASTDRQKLPEDLVSDRDGMVHFPSFDDDSSDESGKWKSWGNH